MKESVLSLKERKQQHNIGFPTFKLPASTSFPNKTFLRNK